MTVSTKNTPVVLYPYYYDTSCTLQVIVYYISITISFILRPWPSMILASYSQVIACLLYPVSIRKHPFIKPICQCLFLYACFFYSSIISCNPDKISVLFLSLQVLKAASPVILQVILFGALLLYCPVSALTLPLLRLLSPKAQGRKVLRKPSKPCHVAIHWKALAELDEYLQWNIH